MHTEQNQSGLADSDDCRPMHRVSSLNPLLPPVLASPAKAISYQCSLRGEWSPTSPGDTSGHLIAAPRLLARG